MAGKAKKTAQLYERVFFDRLLLVALIFMACAYVMRGTRPGVALEAGAFMLGTLWAYRAATTHPSTTMRLMATMLFLMIGILLSAYLAAAHGLMRG